MINVSLSDLQDNILEVPEVKEFMSELTAKIESEEGRVLIRFSGTEPIVRVMVEHPDKTKAQSYCQALVDKLNQFSK